MNSLLIKQIISMIPSRTIKNEIKKNALCFSNADLIKIVIKYADTFDKMIYFLEKIKSENVEKKLKNIINKAIRYELNKYDLLTRNDDNYVYEIQMEKSSYSAYLAPTFESALNTFKSYFRTYKSYEYKPCQVIIRKKRIADRKSVKDIDNKDIIAVASINSKKKIVRIECAYLNEPNLEECDLYEFPINYPMVFKQYDLVEIITNNENKIFGVNSFNQTSDSIACVLMLDSEYVKNKTIESVDENGYYPYLMCHDHIDFGCLELVDTSAISETLKEDYSYIIKSLKNIGNY